MTIGTKQGCPMSSTLFNLYINDIPNIISCANCDPVKLDNQKINCLLYADDLVLLSETSQGLQQSLNTLYSYCKKWKLKVNIKKTKLMVFNSRNYRINAYLGQDLIEQVDKYTYLGCIMTPSGSFKENNKYLYDKAMRALFSIKRELDSVTHNNIPLNIYIKLFNYQVLPILLYSSECWGAYLHKSISKCGLTDAVLFKSKDIIEKLHTKFCKLILQMPKNATNIACKAELGRYPLLLNISKRIMSYYNNIISKPDNTLVYKAYLTQIKLQSSTTCQNWLTFIKSINKSLFGGGQFQCNSKIDIDCFNIKFKSFYMDKFFKIIKNNPKLHLYKDIKHNYNSESYLFLVNNPRHRKNITSLRIGAHKLPIETGRYNETPHHLRTCPVCPNQIGNEEHLILHCTFPQILLIRNELLSNLLKVKPSFNKFQSNYTLLNYIFLFNDYDIISYVVNAISEMYSIYTSKCINIK